VTLTLRSERTVGGMRFSVSAGGQLLDIEQWALAEAILLSNREPARVGVLLRLLEDERADLRDGEIVVPDSEIAQLEDGERRGLGLPRSSHLELELRGSGAFADPDFAIEVRLFHPDGRPVVGAVRDGCFLEVGGESSVLAEPLYSLWEAVDRFNAVRPATTEERMLAWAPIAAELPEGVQLGDELASVRIVLASAFSLRPFRNAAGEPDVDPVLGRFAERQRGAETEREFDESLPEARHEEFAKRFRGLSGVKRRYLAGAGYYVVLDERVERALRVVHEVQQSDAGTRRRFLTRPSAFLREALEPTEETADARPSDGQIDEIFFDEGLSERVKGIGIWQPKVLPWLKPSGEMWLPEDPAGLLIDGRPLPIPENEAPALLEKVRRARAEGRDSVEFADTRVPATEETEAALGALIERAAAAPPKDDQEPSPPSSKLALLVIDNLDQLGFRMEPRGGRASTERIPECLATTLLPHQQEGLRWLQQHWVNGSPGALLADDMGLGKTLQVLAFLAWQQEEMIAGRWSRRPLLVVAPTGLLRNWRDEHDRHLAGAGLGELLEAFGPGLRRLRSAQDREGGELASGLPSLDTAALGRADWVLTTYETLRDYQHSFSRVHWGAIAFDEAQKIKNPAAGMTDAAKGMKQDFTIAMTGTPVENRIEDLWSILDVARPGGLGAGKDFSLRFASEDPDRKHAELAALRVELLEGPPPPIMMRRLKEDHLEGLPEKEIHTHRLAMPGPQAEAYHAAVLEARRGAPMLGVLQQLRSISLHPAAGDDAPDDPFIGQSARLVLTFRLLDEIRARGEKALVFVDSRAIQGPLMELLQRRYRLRDRVLIINGEISGKHRKARVDEFQERRGFDVMILSPKAGGVGLTLTAANHVIHLARWWNPAVEDQCTDRVYRIGQDKPVHVHNVLAVHPEFEERSFDVRLAALLDRKRELNRSVLAPAGGTSADVEELYRETVSD